MREMDIKIVLRFHFNHRTGKNNLLTLTFFLGGGLVISYIANSNTSWLNLCGGKFDNINKNFNAQIF